MRFLLAFFLCFSSDIAARASETIYLDPANCRLLSEAVAGADKLSTTSGMGRALNVLAYDFMAVQVVWASLTGSVDADFDVEVSLDGSNWVQKATFTFSGANGSELISLTNLTEKWMRVNYQHNSVSGGTVTSTCAAKG